MLAANAIRNRLSNDDTGTAAELSVIDDEITKGESSSLTYAISDQDGIDESDLLTPSKRHQATAVVSARSSPTPP